MLSLNRFAAALAAALLVTAPAAAIDIAPSLVGVGDELQRDSGAPLIEFDSDDWASFLGSDTPEFQLSGLGNATDVFGQAAELWVPLTSELGDERVLTQVWKRP